ncbi:MAG: hypothetical protein FJX00_01415 [Alphaproteobacteria bacterium]|nr:hypothetical protein [Alphaproteobacteria bacterium]
MKKTLTALFALSLCVTPIFADDKNDNKQAMNALTFASLTLNSSGAKKTLTYGQFQEMLGNLIDNLKESGQQLSEDKMATVEKMIHDYMVSDGALTLVAMASDVKNTEKVKETIARATEKIIKDAYRLAEMTKMQEKLQADGFKTLYKEIETQIIAEKGDQVTLSVFPLNQSADEARIIKKMNSISSSEAKAKAWNKLSKSSGGEQKTLDPILLSDAPDLIKSKMIKCKTGDVISISSPFDPNNPKQPAKTVLFYVVKREKITGDLLGQAVAAKLKEKLEKQFNDHIMGQVKIEMFDKKGAPITAASAAK